MDNVNLRVAQMHQQELRRVGDQARLAARSPTPALALPPVPMSRTVPRP